MLLEKSADFSGDLALSELFRNLHVSAFLALYRELHRSYKGRNLSSSAKLLGTAHAHTHTWQDGPDLKEFFPHVLMQYFSFMGILDFTVGQIRIQVQQHSPD